MTKMELMQRKNQSRQEREFHLQQAGVALGIEMECDRLIAELPPDPLPEAPPVGGDNVKPIRRVKDG